MTTMCMDPYGSKNELPRRDRKKSKPVQNKKEKGRGTKENSKETENKNE